jgi:hypothetical protein
MPVRQPLPCIGELVGRQRLLEFLAVDLGLDAAHPHFAVTYEIRFQSGLWFQPSRQSDAARMKSLTAGSQQRVHF